MKAKQFVQQVNEQKNLNWANSDIPYEVQLVFEKIASHFAWCKGCQAEFDAMNYPTENLMDFFVRFSDQLSIDSLCDWICSNQLFEIWIDDILRGEEIWNPKLAGTNFGASTPAELMGDYLENAIYSRWIEAAKKQEDSWYAVLDGTPFEVKRVA